MISAAVFFRSLLEPMPMTSGIVVPGFTVKGLAINCSMCPGLILPADHERIGACFAASGPIFTLSRWHAAQLNSLSSTSP